MDRCEMRRPGSMPLLIEAETAPAHHCHRLIILGSARSGKTSIAARFLYNKFDDKYTPTIEDFHRKIYRIKGEAHRLDILDTSGNHPFPAMRRLSLLTGDLFLLVFAVDNRESFEEVKRLQEQIMQTKEESGQASSSGPLLRRRKIIPMVIVGNKTDKEAERTVETSELRELVERSPGCGYVEASAKQNINIEEIFLKLFVLGKLPTEMSPSLHRKVMPSYVGSSSPRGSKRGMSLRKKLSDACGAVAPNPRRPSIRTDLLILQTKQSMSDADLSTRLKESRHCILQ